MGLVHMDSMTDLASWTIVQGAATLSSVAGRSTFNATRFSYGSPYGLLRYNIPVATEEHATITIGMAVKPNATMAANALQIICTLRSDAGATEHVHLTYNTNKWLIKRAPNTNISGPSTAATIADAWSFIEFTATLGDSPNGMVSLKQNGVYVLGPTTSIDTKNAGTKTVFDNLYVWTPQIGSGMTLDVADVWVVTGTTTPIYGDCVMAEIFPSGNGVFPGGANQWIGSDADSVDNYLLVNESGTPVSPPNVHTTTLNAREVYTMSNPSLGGRSVRAVGVLGHLNSTGAVGYGAPVSVFTTQTPPTNNTNSDYNLAASFQTTVAGRITGLRFYRDASSVLTTRPLKLWTEAGALIATANTSGESGSGWHSVTITPYSIAAGTSVRASYYIGTNDVYSRTPDPGGGIPIVSNPPLTRLSPTYSITGVNNFPTTVSQADFWIDIIFEPETPGNAKLILANADGTSSVTSASQSVTSTAKTISGMFPTAADGTVWTPTKVDDLQAGVTTGSTTDTVLARLKAVVAAAQITDLAGQVSHQVDMTGAATSEVAQIAGWDQGWNE